MLAKESVRARLESDAGISYTEFSYMLLQAFDFYILCRDYNCELQIGGSDQWGNITAGIDLCRKKLGRHVYGLTLPLITNADGSKFGKTEAGAVWLDPKRTSVYKFYQFWIRTDDRDVVRYLRFFTFLPREALDALEAQHQEKPEARAAHTSLAKAVTELIHGPSATAEAVRASEILFGGGLEGISENTFNEIVAANQRMEQQLAKVGEAVGREGNTRIRVKLGASAGAWGEMENSINLLIDDLGNFGVGRRRFSVALCDRTRRDRLGAVDSFLGRSTGFFETLHRQGLLLFPHLG